MILIACVDDNLGLAFNHRRQSRDRLLRRDLLEVVAGRTLWMSPYSAGQFDPLPPNVRVSEEFWRQAGPGEFCFTELQPPGDWLDRLEGVVLYRWMRRYPSDLKFDLPLEGFRLQTRQEFAGSSHPKITREVYVK